MFKDLTQTEKNELIDAAYKYSERQWFSVTAKQLYNRIVKACNNYPTYAGSPKEYITERFFNDETNPLVDRLIELAELDQKTKEVKEKKKQMQFSVENLERERIKVRDAIDLIIKNVKLQTGLDVYAEMHKTKVKICKAAGPGRYYPRAVVATVKLTAIPGVGTTQWGRGRRSMAEYFKDEIDNIRVQAE